MRSNLKPGTLIVSSGLGGTFPRGIPVGTVIAEMKTSELWARTYLLRPAVAPADVSDVMVLLPSRATAGVQTVWKTGSHADSAVKSIVAAGDSLARLQARKRFRCGAATRAELSARVTARAGRDVSGSVRPKPARTPFTPTPAVPAPTTTTP